MLFLSKYNATDIYLGMNIDRPLLDLIKELKDRIER